ncbi:MAG: DUF4157 domain-containing protein [Limnoraphis sp.]
MTQKFISRQKSQSPTTSPPVQTSRFASRPFAEPVQQKAQQPNLQTILQRAERAGNPTEKMAWGNTQPEVQRQGVTENETEESKVQKEAATDTQSQDLEEQKNSEVQTQLDSTIQQQESEQKPEEETVQKQSSPEEEQKDTEVQTQLDSTIQQQESQPEEETVQKQSSPEEEQKDTEVQTQLDSTIQQQESEQKPEEETIQQQSSPEEEQKNSEVQTQLDSTIQQQESQPEEETIQQQSSPEEEQKDTDVQTKLTVGQPGDKYEKEADNVAAKVMTMPETETEENTPQSQDVEKEESTIQKQPIAQSITSVQRRLDSAVNLKSVRDNKAGKAQVTPSLENRLASEKGGGSLLPEDTRSFMESRFGADFSEVRVHDDSQAAQMNQELGAQAFTHGNDIYFNSGKYDPSSGKGQELLAHELTHTIQQTGGKTAKSNNNSNNKKSSKANKVQMKSMTPLAEPTIQRREETSSEAVQTGPTPSTVEGGTSDLPETTGGETAPSAQTPGSSGSTPPGEGGGASSSGGGSSEQPETTGGETAPSAQTPGSSGSTPPGESGGASSSGGGSAAPNSPEADPQFQAVVSKSKNVAEDQKQHEPAQNESQEAQDAAEPPSNEVESKAQDKQVDEMGNTPTPPFDAKAFKEALMNRIAEITPKTLEEADQFKDNNQLESVKNDVTGKVDEAQQDSQGELEEKTKETPDASGITPKPVTPLPPNQVGETPSINEAEKAAPKSKGESEVEAPAQAKSQELDQKMAEANITEEQLAKSNEPQFQSALDSKKAAQTHSETAPKAYRQAEQAQLSQAESTAASTVQEKLQGMHDQRSQSLEQVAGKQVEGKGKDEESRAKIAGDINKIYQTTKTKVDEKLAKLTTDVESVFDAGAEEAKKVFEDYVGKRMDAYKEDRYSGFWGPGKWVADKLFGMPNEVNKFYEEGRDLYIKHMDGIINKVVTIVGQGLTEAKNDVAEGRKQVKEYVAQLPEDLKAIGGEIAANVQSQFDGLEQDIESKQDELIDTLAQKYKENLDAVDARIKEMQEENKGLIQKAIEFVVDVIKTIVELTKMLMQVLARVAGVIPQILADPIGFLNNLITGLRQGLENFLGNITNHLQSGLVGWLTGTMGSMGIEIPEDIFSLKGIFSLTTQILGLHWNYIRGKATKMFGEKTVTGMEESVDTVQVLRDQGPTGLWEQVQSDFGDLKESVMGEIKNLLIVQVIQAGVKWILGLLNPASAFVKAAMAIYDIIMFFVNQGSQVIELVNAVIDAVVAIAKGAVGGAAKLVENALVKALPVVIGFLASLLGIGGMAKKVQDIVEKVRKRIDDAIEKVLKKAVKFAKKVGGKIGGKGNTKNNKAKSGKDDQFDKRTIKQKEADVKRGVAEADKLLQNEKIPLEQVKEHLPAIKTKYKMTSLKLIIDKETDKEETVHIEGKVNPKEEGPRRSRRTSPYDKPKFPEKPEDRLKIFKKISSFQPKTQDKFKYISKDTDTFPKTSDKFTRTDYEEWMENYLKQKHQKDYQTWISKAARNLGNDIDAGKSIDIVKPVGGQSSHNYVMVNPPLKGVDFLEDTSVSGADPALTKAVQDAMGIKPFMKKIAEGDTVNGIDLDKLNKMCEDNRQNVKYLGNNVRQNEKHEWIPCNYSVKVINRAKEQNELAWIELQDELRSNTKDIIFKPNKAKQDKEIDLNKPVMQGHSGALYAIAQLTDKRIKALTVNQKEFHDQARNTFDQTKNISDCISKIENIFTSWIWDGNEEVSNLYKYYCNSQGKSITMDTLKTNQKQGYKNIKNMFNRLKNDFNSNKNKK